MTECALEVGDAIRSVTDLRSLPYGSEVSCGNRESRDIYRREWDGWNSLDTVGYESTISINGYYSVDRIGGLEPPIETPAQYQQRVVTTLIGQARMHGIVGVTEGLAAIGLTPPTCLLPQMWVHGYDPLWGTLPEGTALETGHPEEFPDYGVWVIGASRVIGSRHDRNKFTLRVIGYPDDAEIGEWGECFEPITDFKARVLEAGLAFKQRYDLCAQLEYALHRAGIDV